MNRRKILAAVVPFSVSGCIRLQTSDNEQGNSTQTGSEKESGGKSQRGDNNSPSGTETVDASTSNSQKTYQESTETEVSENDSENTADGNQSQQTLIKVSIDWEQIERSINTQSSLKQYSGFSVNKPGVEISSPTHIGIRLEYPDSDAVFLQSTDRKTADNDGVLRMDVPASDQANLYVAAVSNEGEVNNAIAFASVENIVVQENTTNQLKAAEFEWIETEWFVEEDYREQFETGVFSVDKSKESFDVWYQATYPFHSGEDLPYSELLVGLNGRGGAGDNLEHTHEYYIAAENPSPGNELETEHLLEPALNSEKFNLPGGRHFILPKGSFTVRWE
jgi:hypothetical protein